MDTMEQRIEHSKKPAVKEDSVGNFITPAWQQQLDLITQLCQFSPNILLILAAGLGGKSTFADHFLHKPGKNLRKTMLKAKSDGKVDELLQEIARGFDIEWKGGQETCQQI